MSTISPRKITLFLPGEAKEYTEGINCDRIQDQEGPVVTVKIIAGGRMTIYRGIPYALDVNRQADLSIKHYYEQGGQSQDPKAPIS